MTVCTTIRLESTVDDSIHNDKDWFDEWFIEGNNQKKRTLLANMVVAATVTHKYEMNCRGPDLSYDECEVINYVFLKAPYGVKDNVFKSEDMVKTGVTAITRKTLLTVQPGKWVNGEVIDNVAHLRNSTQREDGRWCHWYLPQWIPNLILGGSNVTNHISPNWMGDDPAQCEKIYIPMNDGGTHWYLLIVSFVDRAVFYVDTWPDNLEKRKSDCHVVLSFIQQYLKGISVQVGILSNVRVDSLKDWEITTPNHVPNQIVFRDSCNCGIYVIHFMTDPCQIPHITPWTVVTAKHRLKIIASLILWRKNTIKWRVIKRASSYYEKSTK